MWMLIRQLPPKEPDAADEPGAVERERRRETSGRGLGRVARSSLLAALGAQEANAVREGTGPVAVLLHPGRSPLAQVSVDRVFDQFECVAGGVYATLEEAERRHSGDVGFLLDIPCPFTDPAGARRERGVVFAHSVRR